MPTRHVLSRDELLAAVLDAFKTTPVVEAYIRDDDAHIAGCTDGEKIIVNVIPEAVETLIHELIHKRFPKWSEHYVTRRARAVFRRLSDEEVKGIYRTYKRRKVNGRPVQLYRHG